LEKTDLAVGDSTRLEIIFDTKTYKSKVTKRPRIQTNEGPPDKHVTITATVVPRPDSTYPVVITPYKLDLSQFSEKPIDQADFRITNVSDQPLHVSLVADEASLFSVKLPETIPPGETAGGQLKLHKDAMAQSFEKSFTFELDDSANSRFTVPVKRTVRVPNQASGATRVLPRHDDGK